MVDGLRIAILSASVMLRIGTDAAAEGAAVEPEASLVESARDALTHDWIETHN